MKTCRPLLEKIKILIILSKGTFSSGVDGGLVGITMHIIIISGCVAVVQGMCSTAAAPFCHSEITQQLAKDAKDGEGRVETETEREKDRH